MQNCFDLLMLNRFFLTPKENNKNGNPKSCQPNVARYLPRGRIIIIFYLKHHVVVLKLLQKFEAAILFPDELWLSETQAHTRMRACTDVFTCYVNTQW